jgi:hypothetical protein
MEAVILRDEVGGMRVDSVAGEEEGISRYAEPDAEGMMDVCRTIVIISSGMQIKAALPDDGKLASSYELPHCPTSRLHECAGRYVKLLKYLQILRSSFAPLDLVGLSFSRYCGSLIVRANTGALVPPLGALFRLRSAFILSVTDLCWRCSAVLSDDFMVFGKVDD